MRPPKHRQSSLRAPLNGVLGTEANVRLLRALCDEPFPMTRTELGRISGLQAKGAHLAANRLLSQGILILVGKGPRQQVELNTKHPLARPLQELFWAEKALVENLLQELRQAMRQLAPDLVSAWIQGAFVHREDRPGEPLTIGVLADSKTLSAVLKRIREAVATIEVSMDVTIELVGFTRPDLAVAKPAERRRLSDVLTLFGLPPLTYTSAADEYWSGHKTVVHQDREEQQALLADVIAKRILRNPAKVHAAREYVARRLKSASEQERHDLQEWDVILSTMSAARLHRFLTDSGERALRLRQTLPFLEVLSPEEREEILSIPRRSDSRRT